MVLEIVEEIKSSFEGTVIDIETIGNFTAFNDSRKCAQITPVIFGCIDNKALKIYCAKSQFSINKLRERIPELLQGLKRPFYAFNAPFEMAVFFHSIGVHVPFERELNLKKFESKKNAVSNLKIPQYKDPFNDNGKLCMEAWLKGDVETAIAHNKSCLLKERDILLQRGFRKPDELEFRKNDY